ncbi:F-box/kelch-repeat protein At5g42360 [Selaginella moellendorffii]|uniref:F-box/kelch-repeat protein At5g42360 n=1 Tax=Selaginella moellendorffii TaxID=88036 RepID=UPI000D1CC0FB|nr:F-box/kelch-repeat protein At5g42360 [Selaginella moellendorffii]|eukprot:XP_024514737.1 F-box/kelch-repeat protein At5g42360 [Selaginella moellendorffii]
MAGHESRRGGSIGLRRSSSAHHHRAGDAAGPHKLLRTVSQRLRRLISGEIVPSVNHGSGRLFFGRDFDDDRPGAARIIHQEQAIIDHHTGKSRPGFFLNFSPGERFPGRTLQEQEEEEAELPEEPTSRCFSRMRSSRREKLLASSLDPSGSARNLCRGCFGSTIPPEELPDSSMFGQDDGHQQQHSIVLPDDVLEMCLARLPFDSLVRARAVCKKWSSLTRSSHFLQLRDRMGSPRPWLFVLGLSRDGVSLGQIQALDPTLDRWRSIRADALAGRLLYSVASSGSKLFVVGGCSARASSDREKGGFLKTHRSVLVLDAFTGQWSKAGIGMKSARTTPVVGVFEMTQGIKLKLFAAPEKKTTTTTTTTTNHRRIARKRSAEIGVFRGSSSTGPGGGSSFMDQISARRWQRSYSFRELTTSLGSSSSSSKPSGSSGSGSGSSSAFGLIVIGGEDERNQTLSSGEVYDPSSSSWREIAAWPCTDLGSLCTGVVSKGVLYCYSDSDKLAALDLERNSWHEIAISASGIPSRIQDYLPKLVVCKGRILLVGVVWASRSQHQINGFEQQQPKAARKIWRLEQDRSSSWRWSEVSQHPDAPLDWNAVFIGHGDRIFGVEMFKIFGQVLDFVTVCQFAGSRRKRASWDRASKQRMGQDVDSSSCLTKAAVIVQL